MKVSSYRELIVWQKAMVLVTYIYKETRSFPKIERFGLTSQMQRAAISIPANIAEGQARNTTGEFRQFLGISKGSLAELETEIEIAFNLEYVAMEKRNELMSHCAEINRMLHALIRKLR